MTAPTAEPRRFRNLAKRSVTAAALLAVALAAFYAGRVPFWLLALLLSLAMTVEWAWLMQAPRWKTAVAALIMAALMLFALPEFRPADAVTALAVAGAAALGAAATASLRLGGGLLYIGLASVAIVFLRETAGLALALWTLATVWATDIGAYFAGVTIGGRKLAPQFSPNKTWAGLIGGIVAAMLVASGFVLWGGLRPSFVPLSGLLAIVAQLGDLYESWLKRRAGVKDSSNLFPGHGGALDRLDGLMPVAICVAAMTAAGLL